MLLVSRTDRDTLFSVVPVVKSEFEYDEVAMGLTDVHRFLFFHTLSFTSILSSIAQT